MNKEIEIPDGYEARIEGNKVILEPKESEDERIRKELLFHIQSEIDTYNNMISGDYDSRDKEDKKVHSMLKRAKAYLERQKEQKPVNDRYMEGYMDGYAKGHKDAENSYNRAVSYHLDTNVINDAPIIDESMEDKDAKEPTPKQDYSGLTDLERAIHRGFLCAGVENVPVGIIKDTAQDCLAHIKPAEWSEEDDALLKEIVSFFKDGTVKLQHDLDLYAGFLENKFKSLHPSWKPSKGQMRNLRCVISGCSYDIESLIELENNLQKL